MRIYLLFGLITALFFTACKSDSVLKQSPKLLAIHTAPAILKKAPYHDIYPAVVVAKKEVIIASQISGYVTELGFQDGELVHKGQLLYKIDSTIYIANLNNAIANLNMREAELEKAYKDFLRYRELLTQQATSQQQVDYAEASYTQAKKLVEAARAKVQAEQKNLGFTKIYAPFTGTIGISKVRVGSNVLPGQSVLNTLSSNDPMYVDFFVEQGKIAQIKRIARNNSKAFSVYLDNQNSALPAKVELFDRALNSETGSIRVRLVLSNSEGKLKAGMNVSVKVLSQGDEPVITIPYQAVTAQMGEFFVYVLQADSTVRQEYIRLGAELGSEVIVKQGLQAGEEIVIDGLQKLKNGMKVSRIQDIPH